MAALSRDSLISAKEKRQLKRSINPRRFKRVKNINRVTIRRIEEYNYVED